MVYAMHCVCTWSTPGSYMTTFLCFTRGLLYKKHRENCACISVALKAHSVTHTHTHTHTHTRTHTHTLTHTHAHTHAHAHAQQRCWACSRAHSNKAIISFYIHWRPSFHDVHHFILHPLTFFTSQFCFLRVYTGQGEIANSLLRGWKRTESYEIKRKQKRQLQAWRNCSLKEKEQSRGGSQVDGKKKGSKRSRLDAKRR